MCGSCSLSFSLLSPFSGLGALHLLFPEAESPDGDQPLYPSLGKAIWTLNPNYLSNGTLAAPGVMLPDLDEDGVRDLVVLAIGEVQVCSMLIGPCLLQQQLQLESVPRIISRSIA